MSTPSRVGLFALICVLCAAAVVVYVRTSDDRAPASVVTTPARPIAEVAAVPHMVFRATHDGDGYGRVGLVAAAEPAGARALTDMRCDRVHVAAERGICLRVEPGILPRYEAALFDADFNVTNRFDLAGQPSRAQMAPDGSLAAYTVFVTGHSYAQGGFSTRTAIVDGASGSEITDLEQFTVRRDGEVFDREDFNFWGVTFTDDPNRFYATLGTGDEFLLVEGDVAAREAVVLTDDLECPSLSPDGSRVAFKVRHVDSFGLVSWSLAVLDLTTMQRTDLAETRNVDDQVEWLDDNTVMYGVDDRDSFSPRTEVWRVPADGTGEPTLLLDGAWSPVMVG